jgi:hypothetical protein
MTMAVVTMKGSTTTTGREYFSPTVMLWLIASLLIPSTSWAMPVQISINQVGMENQHLFFATDLVLLTMDKPNDPVVPCIERSRMFVRAPRRRVRTWYCSKAQWIDLMLCLFHSFAQQHLYHYPLHCFNDTTTPTKTVST